MCQGEFLYNYGPPLAPPSFRAHEFHLRWIRSFSAVLAFEPFSQSFPQSSLGKTFSTPFHVVSFLGLLQEDQDHLCPLRYVLREIHFFFGETLWKQMSFRTVRISWVADVGKNWRVSQSLQRIMTIPRPPGMPPLPRAVPPRPPGMCCPQQKEPEKDFFWLKIVRRKRKKRAGFERIIKTNI